MRHTYFIRQQLKKAKTRTFITLSALGLMLGAGGLSLALVGTTYAISNTGYSLFGDASIVQPGHNSINAVQIESSTTVSPGYGGIDFGIPQGVTNLSSLNNLSSDYEFTNGSCGGGTPRFGVTVSTGTNTTANVFFYVGPTPNYTGCPLNTWVNTGNLAASSNTVDATQLGGSFYEPYSEVQSNYGSDTVTDVFVVTDGDWFVNPQTVRFDNTVINSNTFTYDQPATKDSCKDNGWTNFNNPTFKNQGQCVSWVEHNVDGHGH